MSNIVRATNPVPVATPLILPMGERLINANHPLSLMLLPGAGGSLQVYVSNSVNAGDRGAGSAAASWVDSGSGALTTATELVRTANCEAIKIVATTTDGSVEQKG